MTINQDILNELDQYEVMLRELNVEPLAHWIKRFSGESDNSRYKNETIGKFLVEYQEFVTDYFQFIKSKIAVSKGSINLKDSRRYMYRTIRNLADEWDIISRVCSQREVKKYRDKFKDTEKIAGELYEQYRGFKVKDSEGQPVTPIVYFGKLFSITRYLFTPYPILSLQHQAWGRPELWRSGIVHELMHHVFWNALSFEHESVVSSARKKFRDSIKQGIDKKGLDNEEKESLVVMWQNWTEELFVDISATLMIGIDYADSTLLLLDERTERGSQMLFDDFVHPIPIIRPYISYLVLKWIQDHYPFPDGDLAASRQQLIKYLADFKSNWDERFALIDPKNGPLPMHRQVTIDNLMKSVQQVIPHLLNQKVWINSEQEFVQLHELFAIDKWLADLASRTSERARVVKTARRVIKAYEPKSVSFKNWLQFVEENNSGSNDKDISIDSILKLDLGEEDFLVLAGCYRAVPIKRFGKIIRHECGAQCSCNS